VETLRSEVDRKAQKYEYSKGKLQTELELLKEENKKLRRGGQAAAKTKNNEEVFFIAQESKSPSLTNWSSNPRL
jgi:hypothetical protein